LLDEPNVDVNCKDEKGRTLLMLSLVSLNEDSYDFIKYLLKKGADMSIADLDGQTALHYAAKYNPKNVVN
jgi:ankyrin repeat protein